MHKKIKRSRKKIEAMLWCRSFINDYHCVGCGHYKDALPLDYEELKTIFHVLGEAERIRYIIRDTEIIIKGEE